MAIDPDKFRTFRDGIEEIVEMAPGSNNINKTVMDTVLGEAIEEIDDLVEESRPPRLYVFGRSGAGKSSLINALANKQVADVGSVEPTTTESDMYHIEFPDRYSSWDIVDSRGLFETVSPDGDLPADTVEFMRKDLEEYRPDILIHVMTPDQVRAGKEDFETVKSLREEFGNLFPPILYCLNKVDDHGAPNQWPPEDYPTLAGDIKKNLDFVADTILEEGSKEAVNGNRPLYGYEFESDQHIGVIPAFLMGDAPQGYWNVEQLSTLIFDFLPTDARLQFMQAQRREQLMREMSRELTKRFSVIAGTWGASPTSVADIGPLTGLQLLLVGLVGGLSCRDIGREAVEDYVTSMGSTTVAAVGFRGLARGIIQFVPGLGQAVSGAVAGGGTYAVGRSAEKYFFDDEIEKPSVFVGKGKQFVQDRI